MDSRRWDGYAQRPDDIIVATYPKCGTTWTQRIVDLLIFQSPAPRQFSAASPWIDATFFAPIEADLALIEAQTHRRFVKSHMPLDAIPVYEGVKVIHTARDGRDACMSMHNHMLGFVPMMGARIAAQAVAQGAPPPARLQTPEDPRDFFLQWMTTAEARASDPAGELPFCEFEQTYWARRREPWLLMIHFNDLKADLVGEMRRIAAFLQIQTPEPLLAELADAARFETMKRQGEEMLPNLRNVFDNGHERFLNKGENGRWKDILTEGDLARYDALVKARLTPAHAAWIEGGRRTAGDPRASAD
jgi:aryl sulfotransferase